MIDSRHAPDGPQGPARRVVVLIPTFNERENLPGIVRRVRASVPEADILVLDDSSPDGTGEVAAALAADDPHVQVLHRAGKRGLGLAYLEGFEWALQAGYDALVEMDADGSHQPEQLGALLHALDTADLVLGSRWVRGGAVLNWPAPRKLLSRGGNLYTRALLGMPVRDATGGYRVYRADAVRRMDLQGVASQGYCFQVDLVWRALKRGLTVVEVPITFIERQAGSSKMSGDIVRESLLRVTLWGIGHRSRQAAGVLCRGATRLGTRKEPTWHRLG